MANVSIYKTIERDELTGHDQQGEGALGPIATAIFGYEEKRKTRLKELRAGLQGDSKQIELNTQFQAGSPEQKPVTNTVSIPNHAPIFSIATTAERRARRPVQTEGDQVARPLLSVFEKAANYFRRDNNPAQIFRQRQEAKQKNKAA